MAYSNEQIEDLKTIFGVPVSVHHEGGFDYLYIPGLKLPPGCHPTQTDVLFCPVAHSGYENRLFFKDQVQHPEQIPGRPNWQPTQFILVRQWHNFSYRGVLPGKFTDMIMNHLRGLYSA